MEEASGELPTLQPSLFPADLVETLPDRKVDRVEQLRAKRPGRPAGAMNRKTLAFREYALAHGPHPADVLIAIYSRPVHVLREEIGGTLEGALKLQIAAAEAVLPYVESRMPQAVNVSGSGLVQLNINLGGGGDALDVSDDGVIRIDGEIIDNQGVS